MMDREIKRNAFDSFQGQVEHLDSQMTGLQRALGRESPAARGIAEMRAAGVSEMTQLAFQLTVAETKAASVVAAMPKVTAMMNEVLSTSAVAARTMSNVTAAGALHLLQSRNDALSAFGQMHANGELSAQDYRLMCGLTLEDAAEEIGQLRRRKAAAAASMNRAADSAFARFDDFSKTIRGD